MAAGESRDFNVNLYTESPQGCSNLEAEVQMACERLKLYQILNNASSPQEIREKLSESPLFVLLLPDLNSSIARKVDLHSHFTLRTAYSLSHSSLFIKLELQWFKLRYDALTDKDKLEFIKQNNCKFLDVSVEERVTLKLADNLTLKIRFEEVPSLLRSNNPVHLGFLYLKFAETVYWFMDQLERFLVKEMLRVKQASANHIDDRLKEIINRLVLVKPYYSRFASEPMKLKNLDRSAVRHFPLCMRTQHEFLIKTYHLKYFSRLEYGLFLKGIGLSLDDCLELFRSTFVNEMPEQRFWRRYSYLFKHLYGTVGSCIDREPFSCDYIIDEHVPPNQVNGCPYKNWSDEQLDAKLTEIGLSKTSIDEILRFKSEEKYTHACATYFQGCHWGCNSKDPIQHPNEYYADSCKIIDIEDMCISDSE